VVVVVPVQNLLALHRLASKPEIRVVAKDDGAGDEARRRLTERKGSIVGVLRRLPFRRRRRGEASSRPVVVHAEGAPRRRDISRPTEGVTDDLDEVAVPVRYALEASVEVRLGRSGSGAARRFVNARSILWAHLADVWRLAGWRQELLAPRELVVVRCDLSVSADDRSRAT